MVTGECRGGKVDDAFVFNCRLPHERMTGYAPARRKIFIRMERK